MKCMRKNQSMVREEGEIEERSDKAPSENPPPPKKKKKKKIYIYICTQRVREGKSDNIRDQQTDRVNRTTDLGNQKTH